ncbi:MAG: DDE-type integrase/transposase/recombinase, partial [Brevinema sp.]
MKKYIYVFLCAFMACLTFSSCMQKENSSTFNSNYVFGVIESTQQKHLSYITYYDEQLQKIDNQKIELILNRDFTTTTINEKWVTDITYIHVLNECLIYLASVMDLHDRKIIGWSYGKSITAELALQAVKNACLNVKDTKGIIL